jgi:hypothetical protein
LPSTPGSTPSTCSTRTARPSSSTRSGTSRLGRRRARLAGAREDLHHRLLGNGNGHCTRPAELDCHFESICETCTFFSTNSEFAPTLQRQRDHAAEREQLDRVDLFNLLLDRINDEKIA